MYASNELQHEHEYHINPANAHQDNWETVEAFRTGNTAAFVALILPLTSRMERIAQAITHNSADTEDVRQRAILKAYIHRQQLRSADKFVSWVMRITANEAFIQRRHERPQIFSSLEDCPISDLPRDERVPLDHLEQEEERASVREALESVNPEQREILMMHYWEEKPLDQIARKLGISRSNAKIRLFRARRSLRTVLEQQHNDRNKDSFRPGRTQCGGSRFQKGKLK
jgi:RNA polymerase sigma factor (sigma-70 family)